MNLQSTSKYLILALVLSLVACQSPAPKTEDTTSSNTEASSATSSKELITVDRQGAIMLNGAKVSLENLPTTLADYLSTLTTIPDEIPVQFDEEILMGTRGAVRDAVASGIQMAKDKKNKPQ
jgi:biopolymer transport protein ExbD